MKVISNIENIDFPINSSVLTIGTFDGLHRGHQYLVSELSSLSRKMRSSSVLVTFTPNPYIVLNNIKPENYHIINREKKYNIIQNLGIDILLEINFNESIASMKAYDFLKKFIIDPFTPTDIMIGYDHHFGHKREGNVDFLKQYQSKFDYKLHVAKPFAVEGKTASSSMIRKLISDGDIAEANKYFGRNYSVAGLIASGEGVGRKISFPTANISLSSIKQLVPGEGVYLIKGNVDNCSYYGMCNIGYNPTLSNAKEKAFEVHLFNYNKYDLYDKYITIEFVDYIRCERKFDNKEDLKNQLEKDKEYCMSILN